MFVFLNCTLYSKLVIVINEWKHTKFHVSYLSLLWFWLCDMSLKLMAIKNNKMAVIKQYELHNRIRTNSIRLNFLDSNNLQTNLILARIIRVGLLL